MRLRDEVASRRIEILAAAERNGAKDVRLFGSAARGSERPDSDADFIATLEPGRSFLDLTRLERTLEDLLGRSVDVVTERSVRAAMREDILREAVRV